MTVAEKPRHGATSAPVHHLIGGKEQPSKSGRTFASVDPSTGEEIAQVAFGEAEDVDAAVLGARRAFERASGRRRAPGERARVMRQIGDLIRENADAIGAHRIARHRQAARPGDRRGASSAADFFTYFAGHAELPDGRTHPADAGYFVYSEREPYGVVGAISPWNYPFLLACWKTAPALAVGNSSSSRWPNSRPLSTSHLARLVLEAGMPPGVFNVVHGDGPTTGAALVAHPGRARS